VLDDLPLRGYPLQRLGHVLAELAQASAAARTRRRQHDAPARQMLGQRTAGRHAPLCHPQHKAAVTGRLLLSGNGLTYTYTAFNKPATITRGTASISFDHDPEHQRYYAQTGLSGVALYISGGGVLAERFAGFRERPAPSGAVSTSTLRSGNKANLGHER
jgi:hypothetical protein